MNQKRLEKSASRFDCLDFWVKQGLTVLSHIGRRHNGMGEQMEKSKGVSESNHLIGVYRKNWGVRRGSFPRIKRGLPALEIFLAAVKSLSDRSTDLWR
ncbi:MAG: hypothetical protein WCB46_03780 [Methanoregula sp.]